MLISPLSAGGYSPSAASSPTQAPAAQPAVFHPSAQPSSPVELPSQAVQPLASANVEQVKDAVDRLNTVVQTMSNDVRFLLDDETRIHVVKVVDTQTEEVIRQFPAQEVIEMAKALDKLQGLLIRQTA